MAVAERCRRGRSSRTEYLARVELEPQLSAESSCSERSCRHWNSATLQIDLETANLPAVLRLLLSMIGDAGELGVSSRRGPPWSS